MASNNQTCEQIKALFPDNTTHEITAEDMRLATDALCMDKETVVIKLPTLADLPSNNSQIYEKSLVTIYDDTNLANNGIYIALINQPIDITGLKKVATVVSAGSTVEWGNIGGDINNQDDLITRLGEKAEKTHTHDIADVTGLQDRLDEKADVGHTHDYTTLTNIPTEFNPSSHTHVIDDVANLSSTLANKADVGHTHEISDVTGLELALNGKQDDLGTPTADESILMGNTAGTIGWIPFHSVLQSHIYIAGAKDVVILDTDTTIDTITIDDLPAGQYFFWIDVTVEIDDDLDIYIRCDGSTPLTEFRINPRSGELVFPWVYGFPLSWDGGAYETTLIIRKQNDSFNAIAKYADFMLYRLY
jgi:hypothetical protein